MFFTQAFYRYLRSLLGPCVICSFFIGLYLLLCIPIVHAAQPLDCNTLLPAPNKDGLWGYVNACSREVVITPRYAGALFFHDGYAIVEKEFPEQRYTYSMLNGGSGEVVPRGQGIVAVDGAEPLPPMPYRFVDHAKLYADRQKTEPRILPGLFVVNTSKNWGVLDVQKGWLLPIARQAGIIFFPDASFAYMTPKGDYYVPAGQLASEKRYAIPQGYKLEEVLADDQIFLLLKIPPNGVYKNSWEDKEMQASLFSGTMLTPSPYSDIFFFPQCQRMAAYGPRDSKDHATFDILTFSGEKIYSTRIVSKASKEDTQHVSYLAEETNKDPHRIRLDVCTLQSQKEAIQQTQEKSPIPLDKPQAFKDAQGKWGLKNAQGHIFISPRYDSIVRAEKGLWWGRFEDATTVLVDPTTGEEIRIP